MSLENPEKQNSEIAANTGEAGTWLKLLIWICVLQTMLPWSLSEYFDKFNRVFIWYQYDIKNWYHYNMKFYIALRYRYNTIMILEKNII